MSAPHRSVREKEDGTFERKCFSCQTWKDQTEEHFYIMRSTAEKTRTHMFHSCCRLCAREQQRQRRKKDPGTQRRATRRSRDRVRDKRHQALDLLIEVRAFLASLPLAGTVDQLCDASRAVKRKVDLYVVAEEEHVKRSQIMLEAKRNGQKKTTKH